MQRRVVRGTEHDRRDRKGDDDRDDRHRDGEPPWLLEAALDPHQRAPSPHGLDARHVEPARRGGGDEDDRLPRELPGEHDLLQVAAGELPRRDVRARCAHVVAVDHTLRERADLAAEQKRPPRRGRLAI